MNQDQLRDQTVQAIVDWFLHVGQDDNYYRGEAGLVHARRDATDLYRSVVAPLLAERDAERDNAITVGDRLGWRLVEAQEQVKLLKWLHAEASFWLALDRDEHESAEALDVFHRRAVYAEQRYEWAKREIQRLRREVELEANGGNNFSDADRLHKAREESEEGSGRDVTGQASREEAAEQTVGTGYPQGSGPGHGSATPAPLSSRTGVTQTILAGTPGRQGNCIQAAVATLLSLPLDEVPHFAESDGDWVEDMVAFARKHGHSIVWRHGGPPAPAQGLAFGPTIRSADITHAVAIVDAEVWDPHPSRAGLTSVSTYVDWVPAGEVSDG